MSINVFIYIYTKNKYMYPYIHSFVALYSFLGLLIIKLENIKKIKLQIKRGKDKITTLHDN